MGRWAYLDTDEERLPEGMRRVGYDARTQTYTYRDADGSAWEGVPGARYGRLQRANTEPRRAVAATTYGSMGPHESGDDEDEDEDEDDFDQDGEEGADSIGRKKFARYLDGKARELRRWSSQRVASVTGQGASSKPMPSHDGVSRSTEKGLREDGEKVAGIGTTEGNGKPELSVNKKPLPPLPAAKPLSGRQRRRHRRASTISNVARGVMQMFSAESGYRSRRV